MVLQNIAFFLVSTLFSLYIGAVLVRFLLAYARANFHNPLSQFLVKITNPLLVPLRRFVPAIGKVDTASLVLAFVLQLIAVLLLSAIAGKSFDLVYLVLAALVDLVRSLIWIYIIAMIVQAVLSWMGNTHGNPVASLLYSLNAPILTPLRKIVPTIGAVDLTPLAAILLLQVCLIALAPLPGVF